MTTTLCGLEYVLELSEVVRRNAVESRLLVRESAFFEGHREMLGADTATDSAGDGARKDIADCGGANMEVAPSRDGGGDVACVLLTSQYRSDLLAHLGAGVVGMLYDGRIKNDVEEVSCICS